MDSSISIRPAGDADGDAIWAILKPIFRAGETYALPPAISRQDALAFWCGGTHRAFLALDEANAVGTYYLCPNQPPGSGGDHVANAGFATAPEAQGRGIARGMLHHAESEAVRAGFRAMQFNFVVSTNLAALHIWRDEGYEQVGWLPRAYRHPVHGAVDAFVLFKRLDSET